MIKPARLLTAVALTSAMTWTLAVSASAAQPAVMSDGFIATSTPKADSEQSPTETVTIKRDGYGVPHVYAESNYDLFFGYGYVLGEDRLFQMEMARRAVLGTSAEVLGEEYVEIDKQTRQTFSPEAIQDQLDELPEDELDILQGYADGLNHYINRVSDSPDTLLPKQFHDHGFSPEEWSSYDVAMIWIGTMANRFSNGTNEVENLKILQDLMDEHGESKGQELFDQMLWEEDVNAPTTVPREDTKHPNDLPKPSSQASAASKLDLAPISSDLDDAGHDLMLAYGAAGSVGSIPEASNLWITGDEKTEGGGSILVNGPQFDWFNPSYVYGIGLHGAGFDVTGNTPFGYPAVLFGSNNDIAWGSTAGPLDVNDVYQEQLNPDDPQQYWYNDDWHDMEQREETIEVKDSDDIAHTVYSTVHGTVTSLDEEHDTAYSHKRSWAGEEVQSLMAWVGVAKAKSWEDYLAQAQDMAISINWYYSDNDGNIGYISPGRLPDRPASQDPRLPATGDGSMEWNGIRDFSENPQTYNPEQGYIANWNNQAGPEAVGDSGNWGAVDRVHEILAELEAQDTFSPDEAWGIIETTSFADLNIRYLRPSLEAASEAAALDSSAQEHVDLVLDWDGQSLDDDRDGVFDDPQPALMRAWLPLLIEEVFSDDLPEDVYHTYLDDIYPEPGGSARPASGVKLLYNALLGDNAGVEQNFDWFNGDDPQDVLLETYLAAVDELVDEHGDDPDEWEASSPSLEFAHQNFIGVDQADEDEILTTPVYQNRGTENNMIHLNGADASMCSAAPPGQSGFVSLDGGTNNHYQDQLDLYLDFECKAEHLTEDSVTTAAVSTLTIRPTGAVELSQNTAERSSSGLGYGLWFAIGAVVLIGIVVVTVVVRRRSSLGSE